MTDPCQTAEIITAAQPILLALLASVTSALLAWGKGMRTPRREETALREEAKECTCGAHPSQTPPAPMATPDRDPS